ncbi:hexokinase-3 isoform X2 [Hemicordylus capensis]|nr:hexokinase-3 isoform X2 [Hemicordylus capensis]XP_053148778.1 hexokinase-3 isoform X2 [Hemicordylus capensis]XP_053148779.1 hexokinase-3 isoform X2 [Hemicordylus capensis]
MSQTQVKVLLLQLTSKDIKEAVLKTKDFDITENIMKGTGDQLFEFLAQCLAKFLAEIDTKEKYFPLGFSFPFRLQHSSLNQCMLIQSSKDFRWSGMAGNDLAQQLQTAINQQCKNYQIEVIAVVSDTVGTMMSCYNEKNPCAAGLVIDAGTNCCYMEEAQYIVGVKENEGRMCMNTEWGFFGNAGELDDLITEFDLLMDKQSMNPGENRFDKLIGSLYVSDTIRCCLARLAEKGELFNGVLTPNLLTKGNLELHDIIEITDEKLGLSKTKNFLLRQGMVASNQDCFDVQQICQAVFIRSAKLCAAGLAAVLTRIRNAQQLPQLKVSVAVDGNLYKSHKWYCEILQETLTSLAPECTVSFVPASNGIAVGVAMVTAAALRSRTQKQQVVQILAPFRLPVSDLERLRNLMRLEMEKGLSKETHGTASLRMLPTFVRGLPDGTERGKYMALDLGGTNFRVLMVEVRSKEEGGVYMTTEIYTITPEIAQSNATELFDHIVSCIIDFEKKHKVIGATLPLGFTFSFPCKQINLDKGILLAWTKGFSASGCVGEDAVQLLREAVQRQENFDLDVVAIVNDTVGTMMSCAYEDPKCEIGLIVGTGCNACYMEEMRNIGTLDGDEGRMCINMEWGAFGDNGCLEHFFTPFDVKVNEESINVGQQRYEKLISGMYLGEIVRFILLELTERKVLFQGRDARMLQVKDIFPTKFLSEIEKEGLGQQQLCAILEEYKLDASPDDAMVVKEVCCAVSSRAAKVCGAGMAAIVEKIRENRQLEKLEVTAGVDGTLYKVHPTFSKQFAETVALLAPKCKVKFLLSEDGSGKGAALIAAVASRKDMKALG